MLYHKKKDKRKKEKRNGIKNTLSSWSPNLKGNNSTIEVFIYFDCTVNQLKLFTNFPLTEKLYLMVKVYNTFYLFIYLHEKL